MSFTCKDVISSTYFLLDDADETELSIPVALTQLEHVLNLMRQEQILGQLDSIITKTSIDITDPTGVAVNSITNFGDVNYLEFNGQVLDECPVTELDLYKNSGIQRVAFWTDATTLIKYVQLAVPQTGTLTIWHKPETTDSNSMTENVKQDDSLKMCVASRLALSCVPYVHYKDQQKEANKPVLFQSLAGQAAEWRSIYIDKMNRIGVGRPFSRLPFMALDNQ